MPQLGQEAARAAAPGSQSTIPANNLWRAKTGLPCPLCWAHCSHKCIWVFLLLTICVIFILASRSPQIWHNILSPPVTNYCHYHCRQQPRSQFVPQGQGDIENCPEIGRAHV